MSDQVRNQCFSLDEFECAMFFQLQGHTAPQVIHTEDDRAQDTLRKQISGSCRVRRLTERP